MKKIKTTVRKNGQLFGKMDILKYFFESPENEFHTREIARLTNFAPSTMTKYLENLVKKGIITTRTHKGFKLFKANTENYLYKDTKLFYNIYQIKKSGLISYLLEELNHPKAIILFGSFGKSENISGSDIDIFIETPLKKEVDLSKFEKKIGHPIQLFLYSKKGIKSLKLKNKELLNNIVNGILLEGFFEVFK